MGKNSREWRQRFALSRKEKGLCIDCPNKSIVGQTRCSTCALKQKKSQVKRTHDTPWKRFNNSIRWFYGLLPDEYINMMFDQFGRCAICEKFFLKKPHIDHNHRTGKVRGLLCTRCNTGIYMIEDREMLKKTLNYLEKTDGGYQNRDNENHQ